MRFSNSAVVDGVAYIFSRATALGMNAVANLSLSNQFGPRDGTSAFETALSSPRGKKTGRVSLQQYSTAKNVNAVATDPASTVMPKIVRSAVSASKMPISSGHTAPQMNPARIQPMAVKTAMA